MTLQGLVDAMRTAAGATRDPAQIVARLRFPSIEFSRSTDWIKPEYYEADPETGSGFHTVYTEPDQTLAVCVVSLLPGRALAAHDHGTWSASVVIVGSETNILWRRSDDGERAGYADLVEISRASYGPGGFIGFKPADIHSVLNESSETTLTLNLYGVVRERTIAHLFDPVARTVAPLFNG